MNLNGIFKSYLHRVNKKINVHMFQRHHVTLEQAYLNTKRLCESKKLPPDVNVEGVFSCNQLDLDEIKVYGFDYDYTLACYKPSMGYTLYSLARDVLINKYKYPGEIMNLEYNPEFAIRGLHYDIQKGLLMKLDSFVQISSNTVYRGTSLISQKEVLEIYKSIKIPYRYIESDHELGSPKMVQFADLFSVPEINLLCNVAEYFEEKQIDYNPELLYLDVKNSIGESHVRMHELVVKSVDLFLEKNDKLRCFFEKLVKAGKTLFLITNSPFQFVDKGMRLLVGSDWEIFFDVIIVEARKPKFFTNSSRPIRIYDKNTGTNLWDKVNSLCKGKIYYQGTIKHLLRMTGWNGPEVLYFGDHPYSDLADVTLEHGWRTGAIINELMHEITNLNKPEFKRTCNWLQMLVQLIEENQESDESNAAVILKNWEDECDQLRHATKSSFNKHFGSVFRTHHTATYFSRRLFRFADIYTSSITNLLNYSTKHTFYPRRGVMPHEYTSYFV